MSDQITTLTNDNFDSIIKDAQTPVLVTLILFKNGEPEATKVGALSKSQLAAFLDSNI